MNNRQEQIEQARRLIATGISEELVEVLHQQFPELKESEDERIRTRLIALVEAFGQGEYKNGMLAYLERQKELAVIPDELVKNYKLFCEQGGRELALLINAINGFNKQKGQQPAESDVIKGGDFISDGKRVFLVLANVKERNLGETGSTFCEGHILGVDGVVYCNGDNFKKFKRATLNERAKFIHDLKVGVELKEQPEVDLEKEVTHFVDDDKILSKFVKYDDALLIARHFYELGLNARKV